MSRLAAVYLTALCKLYVSCVLCLLGCCWNLADLAATVYQDSATELAHFAILHVLVLSCLVDWTALACLLTYVCEAQLALMCAARLQLLSGSQHAADGFHPFLAMRLSFVIRRLCRLLVSQWACVDTAAGPMQVTQQLAKYLLFFLFV